MFLFPFVQTRAGTDEKKVNRTMKCVLMRLRIAVTAKRLERALALILQPSGLPVEECSPVLPQDMPSFGAMVLMGRSAYLRVKRQPLIGLI